MENEASFFSEATPIRSNIAETLLGLRNCQETSWRVITSLPSTQDSSQNDQTSGSEGGNNKGKDEDICKCRKSKCLKLYCNCFASKQFCHSTCRCIDCANNEENKGLKEAATLAILERNPEAFDSKFKSVEDAPLAVHKHGCRYILI